MGLAARERQSVADRFHSHTATEDMRCRLGCPGPPKCGLLDADSVLLPVGVGDASL